MRQHRTVLTNPRPGARAVAQARDYKSGVATLRTQLKAACVSSRAEIAAREELMRGTDPTLKVEADNQRGRLLATTERLNRGTQQLRAACQIAVETEARVPEPTHASALGRRSQAPLPARSSMIDPPRPFTLAGCG